MDTCLSKCVASNLSWLSVKHRIASTDTDSFLFYAHSSFSNLLLFPIFIPLRGDPPNSLPISCGTFCHKVHYCVPAQICSMSTYCFLFAGRGLSCSRLKLLHLSEAVDIVDFSFLEFSVPFIPVASFSSSSLGSFSGIFLCSVFNVMFLNYVHGPPFTLTWAA